jgi:hypothetical protein
MHALPSIRRRGHPFCQLLFIRLAPLQSQQNHQSSTPSSTPTTTTATTTVHVRTGAHQATAMEAPRPRLPIVAALSAALLLVLAHAHGAASSPAGGPTPVAVRSWVARLQALHDLSVSGEQQQGGGFGECWGAVMGLSSCYGEILLFFVNGESYIGPDCCVAIRGATRYCWPAMLASVGFTAEEADVLRGFCDGEEAEAARAPPPAVPAPPARGLGQLAAVAVRG